MDKGDNNRDCEKKSHLNRNIQFFCNFSLRTAGNSLFTAFSSGVDFFKVSFFSLLSGLKKPCIRMVSDARLLIFFSMFLCLFLMFSRVLHMARIF